MTVPSSKSGNIETSIICYLVLLSRILIRASYDYLKVVCTHSTQNQQLTRILGMDAWTRSSDTIRISLCWVWMSSCLLNVLPRRFQICLRKFVFCLTFEWYHITLSLSWFSVYTSASFKLKYIQRSNSFTVIFVRKFLYLKLWSDSEKTLRLYCLVYLYPRNTKETDS